MKIRLLIEATVQPEDFEWNCEDWWHVPGQDFLNSELLYCAFASGWQTCIASAGCFSQNWRIQSITASSLRTVVSIEWLNYNAAGGCHHCHRPPSLLLVSTCPCDRWPSFPLRLLFKNRQYFPGRLYFRSKLQTWLFSGSLCEQNLHLCNKARSRSKSIV